MFVQLRRAIRIVYWMRPPLRVTKLIVDGCSRGNYRMAASDGILHDHRGVVLTIFRSFLAVSQSFLLSIWEFVRGWSLLLTSVTLCLR